MNRRWVILGVVGLAEMMVIVDLTIVNVALPAIQRDLRFRAPELQWIVTAYAALFGGCLLLGGRTGDLFGRRRVFMAGVFVFTMTSALSAAATTPSMLIASRAAQGLAAAFLSPCGLAIITTVFPRPAERARALRAWTALAVGGGAIGFLLGGMLTTWLSWRWIFLVNVPVGAATLILTRRLYRDPERRTGGTVHVGSALLLTGGLIALMFCVVHLPDSNGNLGPIVAAGGAAASMLIGFVWLQLNEANPLFDLALLRRRALTSATVIQAMTTGPQLAAFYLTSIVLQDVQGYSALQAGVALLPVNVAILLALATSQNLSQVASARQLAVTGLGLSASGLVILSFTTRSTPYLAVTLPGLMLLAFGASLAFIPLVNAAMSSLPIGDQGLASGFFGAAEQLGGALGLAALTAVSAYAASAAGLGSGAAIHSAAILSGYRAASLAGAGIMAAGACLSLVWFPRSEAQKPLPG